MGERVQATETAQPDEPKCEGLAPFCCGNPSCPAHNNEETVMPDAATPAILPFPWQLLYNEHIALTADLARIDREIAALHYRADYELKPVRDVLTVRLEDVTKAIEQYQAWQREQASDG